MTENRAECPMEAVLGPGGEEQRKGYAEQTAWLRGASVPAARQALAARRATQGDGEYNHGATRATADYIARALALNERAARRLSQMTLDLEASLDLHSSRRTFPAL